MSTDQNQLDLNTLQWVKTEIDATLKQARVALELYVESPEEEQQLKLLTNFLYQVRGTLQMVELYGAAMLAEELELLARDIADHKIDGREDIYEIMMQAMWQLPDYLERLQAGYKDVPMVLLPLLNDLRAARGQPLLSESALFAPNLDVDVPVAASPGNESLPKLAKKLRHTFHLGLLDWFRDRDTPGGLEKLDSVIEKLREAANDPEVSRVLWSASGVLEGLKEGGIETSVAVKLLMGQVDRQLKKIIDHGETALAEAPPAELEKNLLYYVASASSSGERIRELKDRFRLAEALPDAETLEQARVDLTGPNAELMQTVSAVLLEDLLQVKDELDVLVRAEEKHLEQLSPLAANLTQVADTLGMLGFGKQRQILQEQAAVLQSLATGERTLEDTDLMTAAHALLSVETLLQGNILSGGDEKPPHQDPAAPEQSRELVDSVMAEARENLARVKESLSQFIDTPRNTELLNDVPIWLDQIRGSFAMMDMTRPAELISGCRDFIQNTMIDAKRSQDPAHMDALADAISSVEYFMDSVSGHWGSPDAILDVAEERLAFIGVGIQPATAPDAQAGFPEDEESTQNLTEPDMQSLSEDTVIDLDVPEFEDAAETQNAPGETDLSELSTTELSLAELDDALVEQGSGDELPTEPSPEGAEATESPATAAEADMDVQEIDFEQALAELDASIEEYVYEPTGDARDEQDTSQITQEIDWDSQVALTGDGPSEAPAPTEVASGLADIEEMTLEPLAAEAAVPTAAEQVDLPVSMDEIESRLKDWFAETGNKKLARKLQKDLKSIKQFAKATEQEDIAKIAKDMIAVIKAVQEGESELTDDIHNILQLANVTMSELLSLQPPPGAPGDKKPAEEESVAVAPAESDTDETPAPETPAGSIAPVEEVDAEIIEIFLDEAKEAHDTICRLLPQWQASPGEEASLSEIRRAFHTLKGSGRLVGAVDVGEFAWAFENMLNRVIDGTVTPGEVMFDVLQLAADSLPELLTRFVSGDQPDPAVYELMEQAEALSQGQVASVSEPGQHQRGDTVAEQSETGSRVPEIDQTLLDIYRKEVANHLAAMRTYIEAWHSDIDRSVSQELLRAVHTMTGSSRTTAVSTLAELFARYENYLQPLMTHGASLPEAAVEVLQACIELAEQTVAVLDQPGAGLPDNQPLLSAIDALAAQFEAPPEEANVTQLQPLAAVPASDQQTNPPADSDDELLAIFLEEATEILDESDQTLHQWYSDKQNPEYIQVMQRLLHTLKGGARLAGLTPMGDLSHHLETMLEAIAEEQMGMSEEAYEILLAAQDALVDMLGQAEIRQPLVSATDIIRRVERLLSKGRGLGPDEIIIEAPQSDEAVADSPSDDPLTEDPDAGTDETISMPDNVVPLTSLTRPDKKAAARQGQEPLPAERTPTRELVRVRSELLDNLVNFAGEVSIYRSRMEQQTNAFRYNLQELDDTVNRLRDQLRKFEMEAEAQIQYRAEESFSHAHEDFDPLEFDRFTQMQQLSRGMLESLNDLDSLRAILSGLTRESETLLVQQSRVNTELQEGLMRTRMVAFSSQANRLRRIVRQTAEELGKKAELNLEGADSEIDRTVLERMLPALEHMLRNAVAHGIESPGLRQEQGKVETGQINLSLAREGADIVLTLQDDGAGIDLAAIQQKAVEKGKLKPGSHVTKETLFDIIMESGFSTAEEITQIAGRGVGMDVVNNEIKQLGGLLKIDTEQGKGTTFTISLPLTLSLTRALMVQVGEETYALPLLSVEGVERITTDELQALYDQDKPIYHWLGQDYPFMHLGSAMGISQPHIPTDRSRIPLLLVRSGEYRAAVQLDNLIGSREIVVKPVGPQLSTMRGIAGATIMGDGSVVLIVDLGVLIRAASIQEELMAEVPAPGPAAEEAHEPVVMVVDDSITVRKITTRLLERHNYRAVSAKDGVDALAQLQEVKPDVMLLDVEMPRMDGFELATNVRNDDRLKAIPIIMITSRTGQKHRDRAEKIGVDIYMGKPYGEGELLDNIQSLLEQRH